MKTIADGAVYTPNAHLSSPWNLIDFFVLISIWIDFIAKLKSDNDLAGIFKGLTALRALRCLTISNTARETFVIVVYDGIGKIFEAGLVSLTLIYPYTIWGFTLFSGRLATCNNGSVDQTGCFNEYSNTVFNWDILAPRVYQNPNLYIDDFQNTFISLYDIISLEGWTDLLQNLLNSTGVGTITENNATPINATYLVSFNFLNMVLILNIFVSFVINNHARTTDTSYQTTEERSWMETKKLLSQTSPKALPNVFEMSQVRRYLYRLTVESKMFCICMSYF